MEEVRYQWEKQWREIDFAEEYKEIDFEPFGEIFSRLFKKGDKVLEAGCGFGRYCVFLQKMGVKSYGIDFSKEAILQAKKLPGINIKRGDVCSLPYKNESFKGYISLGVIEHFKNKSDVKKCFLEAYRVLSAGGYAIFAVPNPSSIFRLYVRLRVLLGSTEGVNHYPIYASDIVKNGRLAGFETVKVSYREFYYPFYLLLRRILGREDLVLRKLLRRVFNFFDMFKILSTEICVEFIKPLDVEKFYFPALMLFRGVELRLLRREIRPKIRFKKALDLGCGDGVTGGIFFRKGEIVYGLDSDSKDLEQAKGTRVYKKLVLADAVSMPFKSGSFDLVFSNCVIEHIKDLEKVLKEVKRVLMPGGYFVFTTPTDAFKKYSMFSFLNLDFLARAYGVSREKRLNHFHCYSLSKWGNILRASGFKVIKGYSYLDKEDIEFWDFLSVFFYILDKVNKRLCWGVYEIFFREKIYKRVLGANIGNLKSSAVCVMGRKI